jgi:hypothetical protein
MKQVIISSVLILFCNLCSKSQKNADVSFREFSSKFSQIQLSKNISDAPKINWGLFQHITTDYISESEIKKFLCIDSTCKLDNARYLYSYWFKASLKNGTYLLTLVSIDNENDENDNAEYGLSNYIFTTYSAQGNILSQVTVGKIRDNFLPNYSSILKISLDTIYAKTIGPYILDYLKPSDKTVCNITEDFYIIENNGFISKLPKKSNTKAIEISWDKKANKINY